MSKIIIIDTGGTFNKIYDPIDGKLKIDKTSIAVKTILEKIKVEDYSIKNLIGKDSLDITKKDRKLLADFIKGTQFDKIIIIHGTDTIDTTALFLQHHIKNKTIILTGSMIPFSIDPIEATSNFSIALGFIKQCIKSNIYIAMHGHVKKYDKIKKNKTLGIFECQK